MYADGTHPTPLPNTGVVFAPSASWDGTKIAGLDINGNFVVESSSGTNVVSLQPASALDSGFTCTWIGNSTIAYHGNNSTAYTIPVGGGNPTLVSNNSGLTQLAGFSDGTPTLILNLSNELICLIIGQNAFNLTPSGVLDSSPSIAPDNQTMAFVRQKLGSVNDGYSGIRTSKITGDDPSLLIPDTTNTNQVTDQITSVSWSPYPSYRRFVGAGGAVTTASSGFLLSQMGAGLSAFFNFTAKTPSTATITPSATASGSAPLVFSVHADSITGLWWKNGFYLPASTTTNLTGVTDTVVSFDGTNGQITFVAPAAAKANSAISKPAIIQSGSLQVCRGQFSAIFDGSGKNLAPGGATEIQVDSKSEKLMSWK